MSGSGWKWESAWIWFWIPLKSGHLYLSKDSSVDHSIFLSLKKESYFSFAVRELFFLFQESW